MFDFCSTTPKLSSIQFFITKSQVAQIREVSTTRFKNIKTLPGTRSYHQFIPLNRKLIAAKRLSNQMEMTIIYDFMKNRVTDSIKFLEISYLCIGDYIACMYVYNWYVGLVEDVCEEEGDVRVSFMHPKGSGRPENCFFWPARQDICHIPESEILGKISAPIPSSKSARKYKLSGSDSEFMADRIELRNK